MMFAMPFARIGQDGFSLIKYADMNHDYDTYLPLLIACPVISLALTLVFKNKHLRWIAALAFIIPVIIPISDAVDDSSWFEMGEGPIIYIFLSVAYIVVNLLSPRYIKHRDKPSQEEDDKNV